jgi:hypothetical protein
VGSHSQQRQPPTWPPTPPPPPPSAESEYQPPVQQLVLDRPDAAPAELAAALPSDVDSAPVTPPSPLSSLSPSSPPRPPGPPVIPLSARFDFDGGAGTYLGTAVAAFLVTVFTLGICLPWAICMRYGWRTKHTLVDGYRLEFTGRAVALFGQWIKWWLLCVVTLGIYSFWVVPRLTGWITEHQQFNLAAEPTSV